MLRGGLLAGGGVEGVKQGIKIILVNSRRRVFTFDFQRALILPNNVKSIRVLTIKRLYGHLMESTCLFINLCEA